MSDWTGLLPALVFAETVGLAVPVTAAALLHQRRTGGCFGRSVRRSLAGWVVLHSLGAVALWWLGAGVARAGTAFVGGLVAALLLGLLPLAVGQRLVERRGADSGTALRYAAYGWPPALALSYGSFFAPSLVLPGGFGHNHLLAVGGPGVCLLGFCGVSPVAVLTSVLLVVVVFLCPGPFGLMVADHVN
ncbi:MAG: hypothetical protein ABEH90_07650 [Halolamina sp.]